MLGLVKNKKLKTKIMAMMLCGVLIAPNMTLINSYAANINIGNEVVLSTKKQGTVLTSSLNVRRGPSTSYSSLGKLSKGYTFEILGQKDGWYKLNYNGQTAYVSSLSKYVSVKNTNIYKVLATGKIKSSVNVRSGASTSYSKLGQLSSGTKVEVVGKDKASGWYKIVYKNGYAYVSNKYVTVTNSNDTQTPDDSNIEILNKMGKTTSGVNIRKGASTSHNKIGYLGSNTTIEIVGRDKTTGWYKIVYKSGYGYISNKYVKIVENSYEDEFENTQTIPTLKIIASGKIQSGMNVRVGPSTSHQKVGYVKKGDIVKIVAEDKATGWYKISYNDDYAYVNGKYVYMLGQTTASVNVRSGTGSKYSKVGYLKKGTDIEIISQDKSTGWYKIVYKNGYGYISNSYATLSNDSNSLVKKGNGNLYYVNKDGSLFKGGYKVVDNTPYYFDTTTGASINKLVTVSGKKYYVLKNGGYHYGLKEVSGNTYLFHTKHGYAVKGFSSIKSNLYYFDKNGCMVKGTEVPMEGTGVTVVLDSNGKAIDYKIANSEDENKNIVSKMIVAGAKVIGTPYGSGYPNTIWCSSLIYHCFNAAGLNMFTEKTLSHEEANFCLDNKLVIDGFKSIDDYKLLKPGDLIFYNNRNCNSMQKKGYCNRVTPEGYNIHHVAMYIGDGKILESTSSVNTSVETKGVRITTLDSKSQNQQYNLAFAARIIGNMNLSQYMNK